MLEEIVRKNVPFTDVHESKGFDDMGKAGLPTPILQTLRLRQGLQERQENSHIDLFYRSNNVCNFGYIELTDYLKDEGTRFYEYHKLRKIDGGNRILVPPEELRKAGIGPNEPLFFIGNENSILVCKAEDKGVLILHINQHYNNPQAQSHQHSPIS